MSVHRHKGHTFSFLLGGVVYGTDLYAWFPAGTGYADVTFNGWKRLCVMCHKKYVLEKRQVSTDEMPQADDIIFACNIKVEWGGLQPLPATEGVE